MVSEEKQIWHCFGCSKGGDAFGFLMEIEGLEFKEALKVLAEKAGVDLSKFGGQPSDSGDRNRIMEILELATRFFEKQLWEGVGKEKILGYLRGRGLTDETIRAFRLGYAPPGWRNLLEFLVGRGYKIEDIARTGILVEKSDGPAGTGQAGRHYDRFRDRVMFPIADALGKVVGYSGRVAPGGDESQAKYVNTPETLVYHKSRILYGLDKAKQAIKEQKYVLIVEGNMDVIAAHQSGIKNTVAVSGTALTPEQVEILRRYTENLKLLFDMDAAGQEALERSARLGFQREMNIYAVSLTKGKDVSELVQTDPQSFLEDLGKARNAMDYLLDRALRKHDIDQPEGKKLIAREMVDFIREIGNEVERAHWVRKLAGTLGVEDRAINDALAKLSGRAAPTVRRTEAPPAEQPIEQTRETMIEEKMVGLMLVDEGVWRQAEGDLFKSPLPEFVRRSGQAAGYKLERLLDLAESEEMKKNLQRLYFEARYRSGVNDAPEENDPVEAGAQFQVYQHELGRERQKLKQQSILSDIRKAEAAGDRETLKLLMDEFNLISKESN